MTEYLDFDLRVQKRHDGTYQVTADTPAWGDAEGTMEFDPAAADVERYLAAIAAEDTAGDVLVQFGAMLFDKLLPRNVMAALVASLAHARCQDDRLRIRLRLDPPELRAVPWEFLYVPFFDGRLGADVNTALARRVGRFGETVPVEADLPLRVLVVAPMGSGLDVGGEVAKLEEALQPLGALVDVQRLEGKVTLPSLIEALGGDRFHVLHFIGHGKLGSAGGYLEINEDDPQGNPTGLKDKQLSDLIRNQTNLKLVVLNACEGGAVVERSQALAGVAPRLSGAGVPAVVAHQYPVLDDRAVTFSQTFYRNLTSGPNPGLVEDAVARARNNLGVHYPSSRVVGATVLYVQGESGRLFTIATPTAADVEALRARAGRQAGLVQALRQEVESARFPSEAKRRQLAEAETELEALRSRAEAAQAVRHGMEEEPHG